MNYSKLKHCRVCGNENLVPVISLGDQYISALFPTNLDYKLTEQKYPLNLVMCQKTHDTCGTVQLDHEFDLTEMYKVYPYTSATNKAMKPILQDVADAGLKLVDLKAENLVLDIGSNDNLFLSLFASYHCKLMGIDAASVDSVYSSDRLVNVQGQYFNAKTFDHYAGGFKAKLIYCTACFYHMNDPVQALKDMEDCLEDNGIIIIQMAYILPMLRNNMIDNCVIEHATYYSFNNLEWMTKNTGLEIFDGEENNVYGGSMRVFLKKRGNKNYPTTANYLKKLDEELSYGIFNQSVYYGFGVRTKNVGEELLNLLKRLKEDKKSVFVFAASTKGNTILQYYEIDTNLIEFAVDSAPWKIGKYMIGSDLPIISQEEMRLRKPDYLLSLAYSFTNKFIEQEKELIAGGTKFIVPLPEVKVLP